MITSDNVKVAFMIGGALAAAYYVYKLKQSAEQAVEAVKTVIQEDINPASSKNIAYSGVNSIGAKLTGDDSFSLGGWVYDKLH